MTIDRKSALMAGVLHFATLATGILSVAPSVDAQDFLVAAAANGTQVIRAALFQTIMMAAYVGFAVVIYPLLKRHGEALSVGFLGFRTMAGALILVGAILLPLLLAVSRDYVNGQSPDAPHLQSLGGLLRTGRDLVNHVGMIVASSAGSLLLNTLLFRAKLVPRWLSVWGLGGAAVAIGASILVLFGRVEVVTPTYLALNAPIAGQEFTLAIWLIAKGFEPFALRPEHAPLT